MKKSLTSIILGAVLTIMPIHSLTPSKAYALEEVTADSKLPLEKEFSFEDFRHALGKRYETLSETEKTKIKGNYKDKKFKYSSQYESLVYLCYAHTDALYSEDLPGFEKNEFRYFNIGTVDKKRLDEYYEYFPWLREKQALQRKPIENGKVNPDCLLLYYLEYPNILEKRIGFFDPLGIFKNLIKKKK